MVILIQIQKKKTIDSCIDDVCDAKMVLYYPKDSLGFYHVKLAWGGPYYPRFNLYVEAKKSKSGKSPVSANFDTDTYWVLGDSIVFVVPLYNPFTSLYINPYWTRPLPFRLDTVIVNQFDGCIYCTNKKTEMLNTKCQKCSSDITFSGNKYNYTKDINIDKTNKHISDKCNCAKVFYIEYSKPINEIIK